MIVEQIERCLKDIPSSEFAKISQLVVSEELYLTLRWILSEQPGASHWSLLRVGLRVDKYMPSKRFLGLNEKNEIIFIGKL